MAQAHMTLINPTEIGTLQEDQTQLFEWGCGKIHENHTQMDEVLMTEDISTILTGTSHTMSASMYHVGFTDCGLSYSP